MLPSYFEQVDSWRNIIKDKFLLFDSDTISSLESFKAISIINDFNKENTINCYIDLVQLELLRRGNTMAKIAYVDIFKKFTKIELTSKDSTNALEIQKLFHNYEISPSPTDLYLASKLAFYNNNMLLLTGNHTEFIQHIFECKGRILLQKANSYKVISIIAFRDKILDQIEIKR